jgi:hypothetical protein
VTAEMDANAAVDVFREATELNFEDPLRKGSQIIFERYGQLVVTGDLHGHRRNFDKLVKYCALRSSPARFVIVQEVIHEESLAAGQPDRSHALLLDVARWKCEFPDQVFLLQSNHEISQIAGKGILKAGRGVLDDFVAAVEGAYGEDAAPKVMDAMKAFILSYPLAARTPNGVFISHSLPARREMKGFDPSVLNRRVELEDLVDGPAAKFLWGRRHSPELLDRLAEMLGADVFILGHQPQPMGFSQVGERTLILSSDHNHGVFLPIDLSKPVTVPGLVQRIRKFVSVA